MVPRNLSQWLAHIEAVHPAQIELGLERVLAVAGKLDLAPPDFAPAPMTAIVAGTNGKGSTCIFTEAVLRGTGLKVGTTLSPHLRRFNERVRIDGEPLADAALCRSFARVESARGSVPLTYFEYSALVALDCFRRADVDAAVLEVGLGGRLDAFNLVSADVAAITSIGMDHQAFLGDDLESIGREKAGVMRPERPVVLGTEVTDSVLAQAKALGCPVRRAGEDFAISANAREWDYRGAAGSYERLPMGRLAPENCAMGIEIASCLTTVEERAVRWALLHAELPGRCEERWYQDRLLVLDVAHNPDGARFLRRQIESRYPGRRFLAVFGMLADKDTAGVVAALWPLIAGWICVSTRGARGLSADVLGRRLPDAVCPRFAGDAHEALALALSLSAPGDGILAFGSFNLVEQVTEHLERGASP